MELRKCAYCPLALPVGARADAVYCSARCRDAVYRERKREAATWKKPEPVLTPEEIPPHAWMIFALDVLHGAPAHAASYRLTWVGAGPRSTCPPSGAYRLRPFQPPKVPAEGRYQVSWLDEEGEEIATNVELRLWISV